MSAEPGKAVSIQLAWREPHTSGPLLCWRSLIADAIAHFPENDRPDTIWRTHWAPLAIALTSAGFRATLLYRMAAAAYDHLAFPGRVIAAILMWLLRHIYGSSISHRARIYGGLVLPHPHGLVIGAGVTIGPRAWIFHNVTLGGVPGKAGMPCIGADARLFVGAVVVGPIKLGDNVVVSANAVVSSDVPSRTIVRSAEVLYSRLSNRLVVDQPQSLQE